jgi:hypothetical protein
MGIMQVLMGGAASGIVNPLPGGNALTTVTVNQNGTLTLNTSGDLIEQNWYAPTTTSIGNGYHVKFTVLSGSLLRNDAADFTQITTGRIAAAPGIPTSITVDIATDSGGLNVVTTGTYTIAT